MAWGGGPRVRGETQLAPEQEAGQRGEIRASLGDCSVTWCVLSVLEAEQREQTFVECLLTQRFPFVCFLMSCTKLTPLYLL